MMQQAKHFVVIQLVQKEQNEEVDVDDTGRMKRRMVKYDCECAIGFIQHD